MTDSRAISRVLLLGFTLSGKSTVARSLARRLEWDLVDFDLEVELREGMPIGALIEARGEPYFREIEVSMTDEVTRRTNVVIAPGGGWITNQGMLASVRQGTFSVWLEVSAEEAFRRLRAHPTDHPLNAYPDPLTTIQRMLERREHLYQLADHRIPVDDSTAETIAFEIEQVVRGRLSR